MIFVSIGSNLGDRAGWISRALSEMNGRGLRVLRCSSLYETTPVGNVEQPDFLNMACEVETSMPPGQVLERLLRIERELGRRRTVRGGARNIDLDLLFYGGFVRSGPELTLPHPRVSERAFVLVPLAEIAPDFESPTSGLSVAKMLLQCDRAAAVELASEELQSRLTAECGRGPLVG